MEQEVMSSGKGMDRGIFIILWLASGDLVGCGLTACGICRGQTCLFITRNSNKKKWRGKRHWNLAKKKAGVKTVHDNDR